MAESRVPIHIRKFLNDARLNLTDYSVGFAKINQNEYSEDAILGGSGTLVSVENSHLILTADHVLDNLPDQGIIGLILPTRSHAHLHRVVLDMAQTQKIRIARGEVASEGPDLGALLLPAPIVSTLQSIKGFYNLSKRQALYSSAPNIDVGVWILCGMAHEFTREALPERGYNRAKIFRGICGAGIVSNHRNINGFDYINFEISSKGMYGGPQSFEGFSGGGLWQLLTKQTKNREIVILDKILSGVAFYQSELIDRRRSIVCHSRNSVYGAVIDTIRG